MDGTVLVPVELTVFGGALRANVPVPAGDVTPEELLPQFHSIAAAVVHLSVMAAEKQGKKVSCRKGCGACCRQLVPVSETEAYRLVKMVNAMPEPRRGEVLARFERVRARLEREGMLDRVVRSDGLTALERAELSAAYFQLGEACPFLEDECCSIHPEWPMVCREFMVTTPAEWCATLDPRVERVPLPMGPGTALYWINAGPDDTEVGWVPLSLLMEWAKEMPEPPPARPGPEVLMRFVDRMKERVERERADTGENT